MRRDPDSRREQQSRSEGATSVYDDWPIYILGLIVGAIPVVAILVRGGAWGSEPTVGLALCLLCGAALLRSALRTLSTPNDRFPAEGSDSRQSRSRLEAQVRNVFYP